MKIIPEAKREPPIIRIRLLRRKEVKVDPKLGGQWNVPSLVAIRMFHAWWPLECSMLGGQWNVPSLVAIGRFQAWWPLEGSKLGGHWKVPSLVAIGRWRKNPFHLFHFPPTILLTPSIFSLWPHDFTLSWSSAITHAFLSFSSIYKLRLRTST